jgi:polyhydroxybutyrate depolymerase
MAYRMACQAPGLFAGVAAVEAVPVAPCVATDPVPVAIVASEHDPLLSIDQGDRRLIVDHYLEPTVDATAAAWRGLDRCGPQASTRSAGRATVTVWGSCAGGASVELALYQGGSHAWPEGGGPVGPVGLGGKATPSAQQLIWSFFQAVAAHRQTTGYAARSAMWAYYVG